MTKPVQHRHHYTQTPLHTDSVGKDCIGKDCIGKDCIGKDCIGKDCIGKDCISTDRSGELQFPENPAGSMPAGFYPCVSTTATPPASLSSGILYAGLLARPGRITNGRARSPAYKTPLDDAGLF